MAFLANLMGKFWFSQTLFRGFSKLFTTPFSIIGIFLFHGYDIFFSVKNTVGLSVEDKQNMDSRKSLCKSIVKGDCIFFDDSWCSILKITITCLFCYSPVISPSSWFVPAELETTRKKVWPVSILPILNYRWRDIHFLEVCVY